MKRNLIAVAVCTLGLVTAAVAEPTLNVEGNDIVKLNAPEATSYQADSAFAERSMTNEVTSFTQP